MAERRGLKLHVGRLDTTSTARIQQDKFSPAAVTNKIGVSPQIQTQQVEAVEEEGVEDQEDMAPETGPLGEPSISSDPQDNTTQRTYSFRSWCPIASKRKEGRRRTEMEEVKRGVVRPQLHSITKLLAEDDRDDKATAIVYKDDHTKMIFGHVCERKRASDTWVIEKIKEDIARLGCQDVILKGDGEPALVQVLENVKLAREAPSIIQHLPAYVPQANGAAEKAVQDYMGQVRAMTVGLEARLKCKVESDGRSWNGSRNSQVTCCVEDRWERMAEQRTSDCAAGIAPRLSWRSASR